MESADASSVLTVESANASSGDISWPAPQINASGQEVTALLENHNLQLFSSLRPSVGYLLGLAVCGVLGNTLVFLVYFFKLKTYPMRTYILAMSVCDLLTNCFSLPIEVVEVRLHFTFPSGHLCSVSWTIMCLLLLLSGAVLVAVAFDRQKLVCQQNHGSPSRVQRERKFLGACLVVSVLASVPWMGLLELRSVVIPGAAVNGTQCAFVRGSALVHVMSYIYNSLFLVGFVILCYSYGRMAHRLWQHRRERNSAKMTVGTATPTSVCTKYSQNDTSLEMDFTETSQKKDSIEPDPAEVTAAAGTEPPSFTEDVSADTLTPNDTNSSTKAQEVTAPHPRTVLSLCFSRFTCLITCDPTWKGGEKKEKTIAGGRGSRKRISNRTTLMLFVLTIIFCLNYLPYLVVVVLRMASSEEHLIRSLGHNVYYVLIRSLYINSAINPIVYGIYSPRFRRECVSLFRCKT